MTALWILAILAAVAAAAAASGHAIMFKRDVRAAIGWAGFVWIAPFFGPLFYLLFGVNRIRRRAAVLRAGVRRERPASHLHRTHAGLSTRFSRVGDRILGTPVSNGHAIDIHSTGESAFEAMLGAIGSAERSIALSMYIYGNDATGKRCTQALLRAGARGVEVRVLIDAVGSRDDGSQIAAELRSGGVPAALFLPARIPGMRSINLRNHRKLLAIDGTQAFTGGMNIEDGYASRGAPEPIRDTQFGIRGPIVRDMLETFAVDWQFTTGESLEGERWFPPLDRAGDIPARALADGPDESFELARWVVLGAIGAATRSIRIVTPYFVPETALVTALATAALRGVEVDIFIPEVLDHRVVKWASNALLWQVLERGCRVWFTPAPFDHSKIFTVDGEWAFFGSSNWDNRSIRLNFELNVEAFGPTFTQALDALIDERCATARPVTLAEMDARPFPIRLRDGVARLFSPYL